MDAGRQFVQRTAIVLLDAAAHRLHKDAPPFRPPWQENVNVLDVNDDRKRKKAGVHAAVLRLYDGVINAAGDAIRSGRPQPEKIGSRAPNR